MIIHTNSVRYLWEVMENEEYSFLFDKLRVLDLGCNIGAFSLWIHPHAEQVYAVDALQENVDLLNQTIKDNEIGNIRTFTEKVSNLSDFMYGHSLGKVDLLKMDIEGDEYEVLKNKFPSELVSTIIGEYHEGPLGDILTPMGYRYIDLPNNHFIARK